MPRVVHLVVGLTLASLVACGTLVAGEGDEPGPTEDSGVDTRSADDANPGTDGGSDAGCVGARVQCDQGCFDLQNDPQHCGSCPTVCSQPSCEGGLCARTIFVSSTTHDGFFAGIAGADTLCQETAGDAGLKGTYKAWLTDADLPSIKDRFAELANRPIRTVDGALVATSLTAMLVDDAGLVNPIRQNEIGNDVAAAVWTGTRDNGMTVATFTCDSWTSNLAGVSGLTGLTTATAGGTWSVNVAHACNEALSLYCVEQ